MHKLFAGVLAAALCLTLNLSVFAATGYGSETYETVDSYIPIFSPPTVAAVKRAADTAIQEAVRAGADTAVVSFRNIPSLDAESIRIIAEKAEKEGVQPEIRVDAVRGNTVKSRWYINPEQAADLTGELNFEVETEESAVASTQATFNKYFSNRLVVVSLGQRGSFGMTMKLAVKPDLSGMDTGKLSFYAYDKLANMYVKIAAPAHYVDGNGYLHFSTSLGGDIVITESPIARR